MPTKIFIGNLSDDAKNEEVLGLFEKYGTVTECDVLRNFGFVHMQREEDAKSAISGLNGYKLDGLSMNVEISHSKPRGGGGGRGGGGDRSGGGPMRRGSFPQRGAPRGRGGPGGFRGRGRGRGDYHGGPPFDPYGGDGFDGYDMPPPAPYDRRPPMPRRDRDPYSRPPPDYYSRSPESSLDRLYELRRQYEEEYYNYLYGAGRERSPPRYKNGGEYGARPMGGGEAEYPASRPGPSMAPRGYGAGPSSSSMGSSKYSSISSAMLTLAQKIKDSKGGYSKSGPNDNMYNPYDQSPKERERLYNAYEMS